MTETIHNRRAAPCKGCSDRYPACSDHCRKPDFLAWKAEQKKIRENRRKDRALWGYVAKEIEKSRGRK